jgi:hypothetical protein
MLQMLNVNGAKSKRIIPSTILKKGDLLVTQRKPGQTFVVQDVDYKPSGEIKLGGMFENCTATLDSLIADRFEFK